MNSKTITIIATTTINITIIIITILIQRMLLTFHLIPLLCFLSLSVTLFVPLLSFSLFSSSSPFPFSRKEINLCAVLLHKGPAEGCPVNSSLDWPSLRTRQGSHLHLGRVVCVCVSVDPVFLFLFCFLSVCLGLVFVVIWLLILLSFGYHFVVLSWLPVSYRFCCCYLDIVLVINLFYLYICLVVILGGFCGFWVRVS